MTDQASRGGPPEPDERDVSADQLSLGRRLRQPRTILSLVLPLILLVLVFRVALNVDVAQLVQGVSEANKLLLLAAFAVSVVGTVVPELAVEPMPVPSSRPSPPVAETSIDLPAFEKSER